MKCIKLKNIANIRFGLNAKTNNNRDGVRCLQAKDVQENKLKISGNVYVQPDDINEKDFLQPGSVLFTAKGKRHIAAVYDKKEKAVANSSFLILTVNRQIILPEYLAWYINQPKIQNYLAQINKGGTVSVVSKKEFENLMINIPETGVQEKIIRLVNLEKQEQDILNELKDKRKALVQSITNKIFKK